jgi:D-alanyl-D-alanine carboxypeptidase
VTGRGLGAEMRERIFEPLGLRQTSYPDEDDLSLPEPYIRGYDRSDARAGSSAKLPNQEIRPAPTLVTARSTRWLSRS